MKRLIAAALVFVAVSAFAMMIVPSHAAMSSIRGTVYWYDQFGNLHPLSWVQVTANGDGGITTAASTTDGTYMMWVAPGTYNVSASSEPGFIPQAHEVTVTPGGVATVDFNLEPSGKPIPEYPSAVQPAMLVVAALAAMIMIRRRQRTLPTLSK